MHLHINLHVALGFVTLRFFKATDAKCGYPRDVCRFLAANFHATLPRSFPFYRGDSGIKVKVKVMEKRQRILVVESDCARLTMLLLWLDQFGEYDVKGIMPVGNSTSVERYSAEADLIIVADDDSIRESILYINALRKTDCRAQTMLLQTNKCVTDLMVRQIVYDAHVPSSGSLMELNKIIASLLRNASAAKRKSMLSALAKAG